MIDVGATIGTKATIDTIYLTVPTLYKLNIKSIGFFLS
jgi:hypothetical protein